MHFRNAIPLIALSLLAFGSGCYINVQDGEGHGGPGWDDVDDPEFCPCQDNSECDGGEYCLRGFCKPIPPGATTCSTSSDCGHRETCINGICTERCAKTPDCSAPGCSCEDNYCVGQPGTDGGTPAPDAGNGGNDAGTPIPPSTCTKHADCGVGAYCINSTCYLACQSNAQCPASEECKSGVCQPKPAPTVPACSSGAHCPQGQDCVDGTCAKPCTSNAGCLQGYTCVIGYCNPSSPPQGSGKVCAANCDCPAGETCQSGTCQL